MVPLIKVGNMRRAGGFTYFGALFIVALISLALTGAAAIWRIEEQRAKEAELLFIGQQYIDAITSYYHAAPGGAKKYPRTIAELLLDPRYVTVKRHLRRPWLDPLTGSAEWGLVRTKNGGIAGVFSHAAGRPIKQAGFGLLDTFLAGKSSYQDWRFIYIAATDSTLRQPADNSGEGENQDDALMADEAAGDQEPQEDETGEELMPNEAGNNK